MYMHDLLSIGMLEKGTRFQGLNKHARIPSLTIASHPSYLWKVVSERCDKQ